MQIGIEQRDSGNSAREDAASWPALLSRPLVLGGVWLAVTLAVAVYVLYSVQAAGIGYPLDDAWIHQTYARNLAQYGEWSFIPGQPSAGSTAPLWSLLLAGSYFLGLPHFAWTFLLGSLSLFALALLGEALFRAFLPEQRSPFPWAALFLVGEWHLVWAGVSGMETLLMAALIMLALLRSARSRGKDWLLTGALIGLSVWVRPDGITLLGPAGLTLLLVEPNWRARQRSALWLAGGLLLLFVPYLLFNLAIQGSLWPNTFYAKQAEYALEREAPLLLRLSEELVLPLIGSGLFLLPGFLLFAWQAVQRKRWAALSAVIWFLGYALLYAMHLPVTYQYGRYFMPAMPVYFVTGLVGVAVLVARMRSSRVGWILARVWVLSTIGLWLGFYVLGAERYAQDVAIIETEMVAAAKWVGANTPPDAVIAAHDIGALGYFGQRRLLDLAGLVSPEVIPFIRDETRIASWLNAEKANYLVVFSDWYVELPDGKTVVFETNGDFSRESGGSNTVIYQWRP